MNNIDRMIKVGITHGDMNGISYELIFKTFAEQETLELFTPIIYGSLKAASVYEKMFESNCRFNVINSAAEAKHGKLNFIDVCEGDVEVTPGTATATSSAAASRAIGRAMNDFVAGLFDALVMAPSGEIDTPSIIEHLKQLPGVQTHTLMPISIYGNDIIRVASVAGRVGEKKAFEVVSEEDIVERATVLRNALRRDLRIDNPRIAVLTFDSEALEVKNATPEEISAAVQQHIAEVITPAIKRLNDAGIPSFGAYKVNELFDSSNYMQFDGILGMFDNQVIKPISHLYGETCVHLIGGLPLVLTAPVQHPCFNMVGKGEADESSMRSAIYNAIDIFRSRFYYDQPLANPLKKLYHEHREDGEKARFSVRKPFPKKGELPPLASGQNDAVPS